MNASGEGCRVTAAELARRKGGPPIVCLTAYTAPVATILDGRAELLLVGDSLGMVIYGFDSTRAVTLDMMIAHGDAVVCATRRACVVVDLPFGSYEASPAQACETAARVVAETGCAAVKIEGGAALAETVRALAAEGVAVMGHIGLRPQAVPEGGRFRVHGRDAAEAEQVRVRA